MKLWANLLYPKRYTAEIRAVSEEFDTSTAEAVSEREGGITITQNTSTTTEQRTNSTAYHNREEVRNSAVYHTEVHVEVVNHNEIRDATDMERLADRFAEGLREKLYAAVEGVYG